MVPERRCSKDARSFAGSGDCKFSSPRCRPCLVMGHLSPQTLERNTLFVSCSVLRGGERGRRWIISERPCCAVFCPSGRNLLCLPTNGVVCVHICLTSYLPAPS